jgi:hypothetical protein
LVIHSKKKENLTENDLLEAEIDPDKADNQGDKWTFVAVLPDTGFIQTTHTANRNLEEARVFVHDIKDKSDGFAPLFHSDCWFYEQALIDNYCIFQQPVYKGIGRPPTRPIQIVDPQLKYVQVHKKRDSKGKIESISTRIILGDIDDILDTFHDANRCKTVNTDYVESRNGKFRKDNARLIRRTLCHSKKAVLHKAHIEFLAQVYNYTKPVDNLKILIHKDAKKFEKKYIHRTPAMAQNIIQTVLSIKELLFRRPKKRA